MGVQGLEEFWKRSSWRESWSRGAEVSGGSVSLARLEKNGVAVWSLSGSGPPPALGTCAAGRRRRRAGGPRPPSSPSSPAPPAGSHSSVPAGEPVSGHLWARRWQRRRPRPRDWTCAPPTPRGGRRLGWGLAPEPGALMSWRAPGFPPRVPAGIAGTRRGGAPGSAGRAAGSGAPRGPEVLDAAPSPGRASGVAACVPRGLGAPPDGRAAGGAPGDLPTRPSPRSRPSALPSRCPLLSPLSPTVNPARKAEKCPAPRPSALLAAPGTAVPPPRVPLPPPAVARPEPLSSLGRLASQLEAPGMWSSSPRTYAASISNFLRAAQSESLWTLCMWAGVMLHGVRDQR